MNLSVNTAVLLALALGMLAACQPEVPSGVYVCSFDGDCPPEMSCEAGRCVRGCVPTECRPPACGVMDDGCGGSVDCGTDSCGPFDTCGLVFPNLCGCEPAMSCTLEQCGAVDNGCGASLDCGLCDAGQTCDPGTNLCTQCVEPTCGAGDCGQLVNDCGGAPIDCGTVCPGGQVCGPANRCVDNCTLDPDACDGRSCGQVDDGCSGVVECGAGCGLQQRCEEGACVCRRTCDTEGAECGRPSVPGCDVLECGSCAGAQVCDAANQCTCMADPFEPNNRPGEPFGFDATGAAVFEAVVSNAGDHDWYKISQNMPGPNQRIVVDLSGDNSGNEDYDLEAFVMCSAPGAACADDQATIADPSGNLIGCASEQPGTTESVTLDFGCAVVEVLVHVVPRVATSCVPYNLTVNFISNPTPG